MVEKRKRNLYSASIHFALSENKEREKTNLAGERDQMMLAQTEHVNVTYDNHFIIILGEDGVVDDVCVREFPRTFPFSKRISIRRRM